MTVNLADFNSTTERGATLLPMLPNWRSTTANGELSTTRCKSAYDRANSEDSTNVRLSRIRSISRRKRDRLRASCSLLLKPFKVEREPQKSMEQQLLESKPQWGILVRHDRRSDSWISADEETSGDDDSVTLKWRSRTKQVDRSNQKRVSWRVGNNSDELENELVFYDKVDIPDYQAPWSVAYMRSMSKPFEDDVLFDGDADEIDLSYFD